MRGSEQAWQNAYLAGHGRVGRHGGRRLGLRVGVARLSFDDRMVGGHGYMGLWPV